MADILNLNKARKAKARADKAAKARENRVKFGRSRAEKDLESARRAKAIRDIDAHRREDEGE